MSKIKSQNGMSRPAELCCKNIHRVLGVTQDKEVAKLLGLSPSRLANQKSRNSLPLKTITNLLNLCEERGLSLDDLFELPSRNQCECSGDNDYVKTHLQRARRVLNSTRPGLSAALAANIIQFEAFEQLQSEHDLLEKRIKALEESKTVSPNPQSPPASSGGRAT